MADRMDHTLALVLVVVLHVIGLMLALHVAPESRVAAVVVDDALDVIWVPRRASPARQGTSAPRVEPPPAVRARAAPKFRPARVATTPDVATRAIQDPDARSDKSIDIDSRAQRSLDLRLPDLPINFERNPMARRSPPIEAHQDRMTLRFSDPSIRGTWQTLTKARICRDLRGELRSRVGTDGVLEAMREHGCAI